MVCFGIKRRERLRSRVRNVSQKKTMEDYDVYMVINSYRKQMSYGRRQKHDDVLDLEGWQKTSEK